jgi:alkanesulfonate monooxygenase SsuD/methylene tetrahydromethanopterin reductase-like flavin-dependent oxidoreductase (luciferase family)
MKFYVSAAFLDTSEVVEIAKAADDLGYDGMGIPDHVINLIGPLMLWCGSVRSWRRARSNLAR